MAETPDLAAILPGDVIQITDRQDAWFQMLLLVEENRSWGVKAHAMIPTEAGVQTAYYRVPHGKFARVGTAALVEAEIAKARETMVATLKEQGR